jgi:hypothetical protein
MSRFLHQPRQIISVVTVQTADRSSAVAVALAVVSEVLNVRSRHPLANGTVVTDLMRRLIEPGVPLVLGAARSAPRRHMAHARLRREP